MTGPSRRALVVEDDRSIRELLHLHLGLAGFDVEEVANGREALDVVRQRAFDFIVLDVMLPGLDGVSLCRALRAAEANATTPVLMLTARDGEADVVIGLDAGADDYLTKPFRTGEFQARVSALTRRHERRTTGLHQADDSREPIALAPGIVMDVDRRVVRRQDRVVNLTRQEFDLLHHLAARRGIVFTRARLLQTVWADDTFVDERTVDTVISRLRKKLEDDPRQPALIVTARGVGYRFADAD